MWLSVLATVVTLVAIGILLCVTYAGGSSEPFTVDGAAEVDLSTLLASLVGLVVVFGFGG